MDEYTPEEPIDLLLVEDNPGDVRLTEEAFKSTDSEIEFHTVTDGAQAAQYIHRHHAEEPDADLDLVLLDLNLPRIDGFAVLEALDKELDYPPPPVLILTSSKTEEDITKSYEKNANAYLTKPDGPMEFNSMAQAIEDFWIDVARHPPTPT
ncbi:response regulator [Natrinema halophilum]|uniref:Response regulator n=1 Tax=Natrinema halophilum TaxID=1699371 RepID=A0A7D5KDE9_9EURY|nr:response regulator [Natrinema halophilum]QLG49376.1 response regulator [Natrinema halophilum]